MIRLAAVALAAFFVFAACAAASPKREEKHMDERDAILVVIDRVDPFWNTDAGPLYSDADLARLAQTPRAEEILLSVIRDSAQPLKRRFAAVEALLQRGASSWRTPDHERAVAQVMAAAIPQDRIHNRWGLPGEFIGRSGHDLLSLKTGVDESLRPLLDDRKPLQIVGGETATVAQATKPRVCDLAAYLLATRHGIPWKNDRDPKAREQEIAELKRKLP